MIDRAVLRELLSRWQRGELDARQVHEEAERLCDTDPPPPLPESDPRSIPAEVLGQLEVLNHQWITEEDIPAMLVFLDTLPGAEAEGWTAWRAYWDRMDWEERRRAVEGREYYSANASTG